MKTELWTVGKTRVNWIKLGEEDYVKRCFRFAKIERVVIAAEKSSIPEHIRMAESARIMGKLEKSKPAFNVLLDEFGEELTSPLFAACIRTAYERHGRIRFIIGGAYGVNDTVKETVDMQMSISTMTFPHELVRVVFLEQLYRAFTILRGESYHHE